MKKLIKTPSPSMIVASVALFVALGGSAYAIGKNSVGTKQLKNNAVTTKKIKNAAVDGAKVKDGAITTAKIGSGAVTLGKVAAATRLDLRGALAYAQVNALDPSFIAQRTSGFTSIRGQSPGVYCLTLAPAIASRFFDNTGQPARAVVASPEFGNTSLGGTDTPIVFVRGASVDCNDFEVEIHTEAPYNTPAQDISFTVVIP